MKVSFSKALSLIRWLCVIVVVLFLLQQTVAILNGFYLSRVGIEDVPCRHHGDPHIPGPAKIPKMVHQMWIDDDLSTYPNQPSSNDEWKKLYNVTLWTDKTIEQLIATDYPWLYPLYQSYPYNIQRADVSRLAVIHKYGGIYADLDAFPLEDSLEPFMDSDFAIFATHDGNAFSNHFFMAPKNSEILLHLLQNLYKHDLFLPLLPYLRVFMSTGPIFITRELKNLTSTGNYDLVVLRESDLKYVQHGGQGRSWHGIDAIILNLISDYPHIAFLFCFFFILFSLWCRKCYNYLRQGYFNSAPASTKESLPSSS